MNYVIDKDSLWELSYEEVSKVADEAYTEDGTSLYDSVVLTEKDRSTVERFIDDAVGWFVVREFDIAKFSPEMDGESTPAPTGRMQLTFYVPDFDESMAELGEDEATIVSGALFDALNRYIVMYVCAYLFQQRRVVLVQEYTARMQSAMDTAVSILKSRKHPLTSWS